MARKEESQEAREDSGQEKEINMEKLAHSPLEKILDRTEAIITYSPLRTEVPFAEYIPEYVKRYKAKEVYCIPPRAGILPEEESTAALRAAAGKQVAIFIPGKCFDTTGTRHGQGGGWYDRFLTLVPREWLRIGFCFDKQFSETPIPRESWDQVMDVVCVAGEKTKLLHVVSCPHD